YFSPTQRRLRGKLKKWITGDSGGWESHPKYSNSMRRISAKKIGPVLSISKIAAQSGIQIKESDQREFLFMESLQGQKRFIYSNGNQVEAAEYFRQNNKNAIEFIKNNPPLRGADFYTWFDSFLFNFHRTAHTEPNGNIVDGETSVLGVLPSGAILFLAESNPELQWVKKVETSLNRILKKQILNEQSWPAQLVKTEIFSAAIRMFYLQKYAEKVDGGMESNMILYHFSIFSKALEQFGFKERRTMILYQILDVFEKHYPLDFTVWKQELRELLIKMNPRAASSQSLLNAVDNYPLKMSNTCSDILSNP
ncbi:MAG: hypothetical protein KDD34_07710, partial [Bdellovibrionales bacterium]|nr:hypothetical protein [Bdellovibrionales bacterium]